MTPDLHNLAKADATVVALLGGAAKLRFWPFGEADPAPARPYAVWQTAYGNAENKLAGVPDEDRWGVQIDAYAVSGSGARAVAQALRDALEPHGYVVSWNGEFHEPDTKLYRYSFTMEFATTR